LNEKKNTNQSEFISFIIITILIVCVVVAVILGIQTFSSIPTDQKANIFILTSICTVACICFIAFVLYYRNISLSDDDEINDQREQYFLQEKMASLGQMIAGVAHEINTPLAYVSNNVELMHRCLKGVRSDVIDPVDNLQKKTKKSLIDILVNQREMISAVRSNNYSKKLDRAIDLGDDAETGLASISELVATLKDFSRVDRQEHDNASIHELIDLTLKITERHLESSHVDVTRKFDPDVPMLLCQPSKLNQVFLNLIVNACHAIIGGGQLIISTKYDKLNKSTHIKFVDNGMGMTRKTQRSLFDPFYTTKEVGSGSGLGMSIVSSIIKEHEGHIEVDSHLGSGTSISITLPNQKSPSLK